MSNSVSLSLWKIETLSLSDSPATKPQKGLGKPIHQSTSVFSLGGTKAAHQANRYQRRWDHSWTAHPHKERKVPLFVFDQGGSPLTLWLVQDKCLALQFDKKTLLKTALKFDQPTQHRVEGLVTLKDIVSCFFQPFLPFEIRPLSCYLLLLLTGDVTMRRRLLSLWTLALVVKHMDRALSLSLVSPSMPCPQSQQNIKEEEFLDGNTALW